MVLKFKSLNKSLSKASARRACFAETGQRFSRTGRAALFAIFTSAKLLALLSLASIVAHTPLMAQNPAIELDPARPLFTKPPIKGQKPPSIPDAPLFKPRGPGIESGDLAPIRDGEGSGLPIGVWQGMDAATLEKLFSKIDLPPRSPTLSRLWLQLLTSEASFGADKAGIELKILRLEALYRSGHFEELLKLPTERGADQSGRHMAEFIRAKAELGLGRVKSSCDRLKNAGPAGTGMPKGLAIELLKMTIFCRAQAGDINGANLVVDLARDQGIGTTYATRAVLALEAKKRNAPKLPRKVDLVDFNFTALFPKAHLADLIEKASAPVLSAMLNDRRQPQDAYLKIAERCFKLNIIGAQKMADIYKGVKFDPGELNNPRASVSRYKNRPEGRALLYQTVEYERDPMRRASFITQLMTSARKAGLYGKVGRLLKRPLDHIPQTNALQWFSETAIEIALLSGQYEKALSWAIFGSEGDNENPRNLLNWLTLIDIGAPENVLPKGAGLVSTEEAALAGRFSPPTLHRLVTVLDALKYDVPIRLWNHASSAPQPSSGHLPDTGILPKLETAARNNQYGKVILYSMIALGRDGPGGAHMIALGDTIKAMSGAGMKNEARQIALEALYAVWPRSVSN